MSFLEKFRMLAVGAALTAPVVSAQADQTEAPKAPAITQTVTSDFPWENANVPASIKATYASLPAEYKAFANKSFMERVEMREEWEQRDFIKREKDYQQKLKTTPDLSSYAPAEGDYDMRIIQDRFDGRLTPSQMGMVQDLIHLGRPLSTIDLNKPYAEQLKDCGFDVMASVMAGAKERDLSERDHALFIWQIQEAETLRGLGQNPQAWRDYLIRAEKEDQEHYEANHHWYDSLFRTKTRYLTEEEMAQHPVQWEQINGKKLIVPEKNQVSYSVRDEVTRKVGGKIAKENQLLIQKAATKQASH